MLVETVIRLVEKTRQINVVITFFKGEKISS